MLTDADVVELRVDIERLCREVARLQKTAKLLAGRLTPYEDEDLSKVSAPPWDQHVINRFDARQPVTTETLRVFIKQARRQVENAERDFAAMRARVEAIAKDQHLTADWKGWLAEQSRRGSD